MSRLKLLGTVAILGIGALAAQRAEAALAVSFQSGAGPITICQDQAACDLNPVLGALNSQVLGLGPYDFVIDLSQSYPATGSPSLPVLRFSTSGNTDQSNRANSTPLTVRATQTGFTQIGTSIFDLGATVLFPAQLDTAGPLATAAYSFFADNADAQFGTTQLLGSQTFTYTSAATTAQSSNQFANGTVDGSFSLTSQIIFNGIDANRGFGGSANITAQVPEPASLMVLGMSLLGLGLVKRRGKHV